MATLNGSYINDANDVLRHVVGSTILSIHGLEVESEEVKIVTDKGELEILHVEDCCESVFLCDFECDINDLIGKEITLAEERTEDATGEKNEDGYVMYSGTWTFYTIRTTGSDLDMRWLGESNGYYSETAYVRFTSSDNSPRTA